MRTTIDLTAAADSGLQDSGNQQSDRRDFLLDDDRDKLLAEPPSALAPSGDSNRALLFDRPTNQSQSSDSAESARSAGSSAAVSTQNAVALLAAPPAPTIASITEDTGTPGDGITIDDDLLVSGTAQAGATVELFIDAVSLGTTTADGTTGAWSIQTGTIALGAHTLTATATDAGGTSPPSTGFAIEVVAPAPVIALSSLDGSDGFVLAGIDGGTGTFEHDSSGVSVSGAGDVNGDGFADMIIGARQADGGPANSLNQAGESYVIFGRASGFGSVLELSSLDGSNGFLLAGTDVGDWSGYSVSGAGDVNGDGFADLIIGARDADGGPGNPLNQAGESYVVFGQASGFGSVLALSSLDGNNGFLLAGIDAGDRSGRPVSGAGDVNGDGFADLILGAFGAAGGPGNPTGYAGESYVVFGQASGFGSVLQLSSLDGGNGFILAGIDATDFSGRSVSGAGDMNGDGLADLIIGAFSASGGPDNLPLSAGESYVVFGRTSGFGSVVALSSLDGSNGFLLAGIDANDRSGQSVSGAGDVNGDGFADLIVGAREADGGPGNSATNAGESYVVFGRTSGFSSVLELSSLDGSDGFVISGIDAGDRMGTSVSNAGDVNSDGLDDLIIGASVADGGPDGAPAGAGESYVVFGQATGFGSLLDLDTLSADQGFLIAGIDANDATGASVSAAGDVNGDGFADLIIGALYADGGPDNTPVDAGESYVIFGKNFTGSVDQQGNAAANTLTGTSGADVLLGAQGDDTLIGNGGADVLYGGEGDDVLALGDVAPVRVKGGTGTDSLRLDGSSSTLDLTAVSDLKIESIEAVDLQAGSGAHTLILDLLEVLNLSEASNTLTVRGDAADTAFIGTGWTSQGVASGFETFTQGAGTLLIQQGVTVKTVPPLVIDPGSLDGSDGFILAGVDGKDYAGVSVAGAGDVNGDGFEDVIVGAYRADGGPGNPANDAGESYVVFGKASGFGSVVALPSLDGGNGFVLAGAGANDRSGYSVSGAGDVNGDGFADLIVGAHYADGGPGNPASYAGENYVVFGKASGFASALNLSSLDGSDGFVLSGIDSGDLAGRSVSGAGDVNGDGFADLIIGASNANGGPGNPAYNAGESYVVFGKASGFGSAVNLSSLDGSDGFVLSGTGIFDGAGTAVSGVGDVNDDGFADLIVGTPNGDGGPGNPANNAGESYVIFGKAAGFGSVVSSSALDGSNGFVIAGIDGSPILADQSGIAVSGAGDVNGDGIADLIVGAAFADGGPGDPANLAGESYVVFGKAAGFGSVLALSALDGSNGFVIAGADAADLSGRSVSGAGDVNGDGLDDLIVGAAQGSGGPGNPTGQAGESYVVFGRATGFGSLFDLDGLGADRGFVIAGSDANDASGGAVASAGDVNGDGFADLIVGATAADGGPDNTPADAGESYVIFGSDLSGAVTQQGTAAANTLTGTSGTDVLLGAQGNDTLIGNGGADVLYGGEGDDVLAIGDATPARLKGGTGSDTLRLDGSGMTLDLTAVSDLKVEGIEVIDLQAGSGAHTLTLDLLEVLNISKTSNTLTVLGDAADTVFFGFGWASQGVAGGFETFTQGAATLLVQEAVNASAAPPLIIDPGTLDGSDGFVLAGIDALDLSGRSVSGAGDVNGDGFDDVIIGALRGDGGPGNPRSYAGESYVVFGQASGFGSVGELSSLDGNNGFLLAGIDGGNPSDRSGDSVSGAGDVNGDGLADLIIGARLASGGAGNPTSTAGESYVVFGQASGLGSVVELSSLDGSNGFLIAGMDVDDRLGFSASGAGDMNGDGLDDIIIGAYQADGGPGNSLANAGESYVVFGQTSGFGSSLELSSLDGNNGFLLVGVDVGDGSGISVSGAGDVNGDGLDDLIVGARFADGGPGNPQNSAGESYVVFGKASGFNSIMNLSSLDGSNGFLLAGIDGGSPSGDRSGRRVSGAGDLNGDGFADLIVGAYLADGGPGNPAARAGESYVVFGQASGFGSAVNLSSLDGSSGFLLAGIDLNDYSGFSVAGTGDVNGDGLDDLIVGAHLADSGPGNTREGESYVVFGRASGFGSVLNPGALSAEQGFVIAGIDAGDRLGRSVSGAGDINGDGFADLIIGAPYAAGGPDNLPGAFAGESYVIFGEDFTSSVDQQGDAAANTLTGTSGADVMLGAQGNDTLIGNGGADVLYGGEGDDVLAVSDATLARLKGGTGTDTLRLDGLGLTLDLTAVSDLKVESIETVDLQAGSGAHTLTLDLLEVLNLSEASNSLTVLGDAADTVNIGAGWTSQGVASGFETFTQGAATLVIDADITVVP